MAEMNRVSRFFVNLGSSRRAARLLRALEPGFRLPMGGRLLELGAGRGALAALVLERTTPTRLVVTDFDPDQVNAARQSLARRFGQLPESVEFERVDARQLPFGDEAFDVVFAILALHHVEAHHFDYRERPKALQEVRRVLAPGGSLVYSDFSRLPEMRATLTELGLIGGYRRRRWPNGELAVFTKPR